MTSPETVTAKEQRHPSYPTYKDSGVEWLGEIPGHWNCKPLKHAVEIDPETLSGKTDPSYKLAYVDISSVNSIGDIEEPVEYTFENAPSRARKIVRDGDTIISTVRTYLRAIAYIEDPPPNLVVSTGFAVLRPRDNVNKDFLGSLIGSKHFVDSAVSHSEGVGYPAISTSTLGNLPVWLPPLPEQCAIAAFLDRETEKIDALIEKKQRLIERLEEKRTALISHTVTKGLDPDAEMKDSGVEWIGEIPVGWDTVKLKYLSKIENSGEWGEDDRNCEDPIPVITTADISKQSVLDASSVRLRCLSKSQIAYYLCEHGDILVVKSSGSKENVSSGKAVFIKEGGKYGFSNFLTRIRPSVSVESKFLFYQIKSNFVKQRVLRMVSTTTYPNIKMDEYVNMEMPFPSLKEQRAIIEFLDREMEGIDTLIGKVRDGVSRLQEYRTALISAAVTGQIDVRDAVSPAEVNA